MDQASSSRLLRILLVDDEEIVHRTISPYLVDSGHQVESAHDAESALKMVEDNDYDLALVDIKMPGMDGLELLGLIQKERPEMAVVIISGHGTMELAIRALRLGADDFLPKPIKLLELDAVLEKCIRVSGLRRGLNRLKKTIGGLQASEDQRSRNRKFICVSPAMKHVQDQVRMAVDANCETILLSGATGSGKEVVARDKGRVYRRNNR